jgi:hypothetical protein
VSIDSKQELLRERICVSKSTDPDFVVKVFLSSYVRPPVPWVEDLMRVCHDCGDKLGEGYLCTSISDAF